jgi:hypothetical protein
MQSTPIPDLGSLPADVAERLRNVPPINIYRLLGNVPPAVIPWDDPSQRRPARTIRQRPIAPRHALPVAAGPP